MDGFWDSVSKLGGIASIASLFALVMGGVWSLFRKYREKRRDFEDFLRENRDSIKELSSNATTQGKRADLFMYHQSRVARMRHDLLSLEIRHMFFGILIFLFILMALTVEKDARLSFMVRTSEVSETFSRVSHVIVWVAGNILTLLWLWAIRVIRTEKRYIKESDAEFHKTYARVVNKDG